MNGNFNDEHAGKGGSYVMEDGKRVLLERTDTAPAPQATPAPVAAKTNKNVKGEGNV